MRLELLPVPRGLGAITARGHVAPAAASILRVVEEDTLASLIGASAHTRELAKNERVRGGFHDGNHEPRERVADRNERTDECAVGTKLDAPCAGAATKHAIDLDESFGARAFAQRAALGQRAKRGPDTTSIDERRGRAGRLLHGAATNSAGAFSIEHSRGLEPADERLEIAQGIETAKSLLAVDEVQPKSLAHEHERGAFGRDARRREGGQRRGVLRRGECEHRRQRGATSISRDATRSKRGRRHGHVAGYVTYALTCREVAEYICRLLPIAIMNEMLLNQVNTIVVGSTNPVKIGAVRAVLGPLAPRATIDGVAVHSTVPDQPVGDEETIRGAVARARAALAARGADLGVGIEGGVVYEPDGGMRTCAWAAIVDAKGTSGVGGSLAMALPARVAEMIRSGAELGHAMDALIGAHDTKRGAGAVGILTAGLVDRQRAYEVLVSYALARFVSPDLY